MRDARSPSGGSTRRGRRSRWWIAGVLALAASLIGAAPADPVEADKPTVLFVTGNATSLPGADQPLVDRLEDTGYDVHLADDEEVDTVPYLFGGIDLVVVSSSVIPANIETLATSPLPVLVMEAFLFGRMGFTNGLPHQLGETAPQTSVRMGVKPDSTTIGGRLTGLVDFSTAPTPLSFARPAGDVVEIAHVPGSSTRAVLFAYWEGATMAEGFPPAPNRRAAFPFTYGSPLVAGDLAWTLFDRTVEWLRFGCVTTGPLVPPTLRFAPCGAVGVLPPDGELVVFVTGNSESLPRPDRALVELLEADGYEVRLADDDDVADVEGLTAGADILLISSSVNPDVVGSWAAFPRPTMVMEAFLFDDMGFTDGQTGAQGETVPSTDVVFTEAVEGVRAFSINAGYSGRVQLLSRATPLSFGRVVPDGAVIAHLPSSGGRAVLFAFEAGATMADGYPDAPARRVGYLYSFRSPLVTNATGDTIFIRAMDYLRLGS